MDISDLVAHVAVTGGHGPTQLREAMTAAREREVARIAAAPVSATRLGADCLDMCVHAHDLGAALDEPIELNDHLPAATEASRLLLRFAPQLLVTALPGQDATLRVTVRGGSQLERTIVVRDGRLQGSPGGPAHGPGLEPAETIEVDPAALVLLLSGRADPGALRHAGTLAWTGAHAETFVHRARLPG